MSIKTIKLFRTISKIFLILIGVGLVGYLGYLGYISYKFPPYKVTVSNITDSSFTVSWVTDTPTKGYVYYKEKDSFLPGPLGWINSGIAYDDRDWAYNQSVCVNEFNANSEVDDTFTVVNSENFDCEDIEVKDIADFYTHHITLKNLDAEKEYYFRVGNGFWMWEDEENSSKTFSTLTNVGEPYPMFGKVVFSEDIAFNDTVIYGKFVSNLRESESIIYSSVTNEEGGWYIDGGNVRDSNGSILELVPGEDLFRVTGQFLAASLSYVRDWVFMDSSLPYPNINISEDFDINVEKDVKGVFDEVGEVLGDDDKPSLWDRITSDFQNLVKDFGTSNIGKKIAPNLSSLVSSQPNVSIPDSGSTSNPVVTSSPGSLSLTNYDFSSISLRQNSDRTPGTTLAGLFSPESDSPVYLSSSPNNGSSGSGSSSSGSSSSGSSSSGSSGSGSTNTNPIPFQSQLEGTYNEITAMLKANKTVTEICPDCPVGTSADDLLNTFDPKKTQADLTNGFGNNSRIITSFGIEMGEEAFKRIGLPYNEYNIYSLTVAQSGLTSEQVRELNKKGFTPTEIKERIANGEEVIIRSGGDGLLRTYSKLNESSNQIYNATVTKNQDGSYIIKSDYIKDIMGRLHFSNSNSGAQPLLESLFNSCNNEESSNNCIVDLRTIGVNLDSSTFAEFYTKRLSDCKEDILCDVSRVESSTSKVLEKFIGSARTMLTIIQQEKENNLQGTLMYREYQECAGNGYKLNCVQGVLSDYNLDEDDYNIECADTVSEQTCSIVKKDINFNQGQGYPIQMQGDFDAEFNDTSLYTKSGDDLVNEAFKGNIIYKEIQECGVDRVCLENIIETELDSLGVRVVNFCGKSPISTDCLYVAPEDQISPVAERDLVLEFNNSMEYLEYLEGREQDLQKDIENFEGIESEINSSKVFYSKPNLSTSLTRFFSVKSAFAQEATSENSFFFIPEYGAYTLELGPYTFEKEVTDGEQIYVFYLEVNGEEGLQLPPEGDTTYGVGYDVVLEGLASEIKYTKTASAKTYDLKEGINIVSFDFVPSYNKNNIYYAKDLVEQTANRNIEFIARYDAGRWAEGISCKGTDGCFGTDFPLTPGRGYVIRVSEDTKITIPGYEILDPVPVNYSTGWNLVGVHGYSQAYTAGTLIESINKVDGLTADNVSWWPTSKGRYEGLQVTDGTTYGLDFPISPKNGYFVRISKFNPPSSECRSIIWNPGGNLNGVCGDSKSLF